jgi:hypothetical protein
LFNDSEQAVVYVHSFQISGTVAWIKTYSFWRIPAAAYTAPAQKLLQAQALEMHWAGSEANIAVSLSLFGEQLNLYNLCMPRNAVAEAGLAQFAQAQRAKRAFIGRKAGLGCIFMKRPGYPQWQSVIRS